VLVQLFFAVALAAAPLAGALADSTPKPEARAIATGVWMIQGGILPNREPDGNTYIFDAPKGLIVMDTGRHKWHRQAILDFAKARGKPIAAVVNSHWHLDHVSGNPDLRATYPGMKVYASDAVKGALSGFLAKSATAGRRYLDSGKLPPETAEDVREDIATTENGRALFPDVVIDKSATRTVAGKSLLVNLAPNAATDGDVWVFDPVTRVAAVGDLVTLPAPFLDTACAAGWSKALDVIDKTPFKSILPGHGAIMNRAQFDTYRGAFVALVACSGSHRDANACAADWTKSVRDLLGAASQSAKQAQEMTVYYIKDVLRAHGGKSAECKV
jgi:glyoxylase-like metal-dependent hydrolase (beta-lactamase superfamily II)